VSAPKTASQILPITISVVSLVVAGVAFYSRPVSELENRSINSMQEKTPFIRRLNDDKKIRIGFANNPPQASLDPNSKEPTGYHVDLVREIARRANVEVEWEEVSFSNMQLALESRVDAVIGAGFVSVERAETFWFTEPVFRLGLGYVALASNTELNDFDSLKKPGVRVAYAVGSASEEAVDMYFPKCEKVPLPKGELLRVGLEVISGRADAGIVNQAQCQRMIAEHKELKAPLAKVPFYVFESAFSLPYGDLQAKEFWNASIRALQANGFTDELEKKYNPDGLYWTPAK